MSTLHQKPLVRVLNPNTSATVTEAIARAMTAGPGAETCRFECETAASGPAGIVSQEDYEQAGQTVVEYVALHREAADAFVVACFSDPGMAAAREAGGGKPVFGLGEAGMRAALGLGRRVGVVAIADVAIPRHMHYWERLGWRERVAAERALNLRVDQSGDPDVAWEALCRVARLLRDVDGADVLLLGCAGMADLRAPLENAMCLPVVDPCAAAAAEAVRALSIDSDASR